MPTGIRGILIAGIFATAMGSLSAALNALATSFTRDWYLPYIRPDADETRTVRAAKGFTVLFAMLMILVASGTAYAVIKHPGLRVIPIALGIFGYTYGALLGVFLVGMLTKTRGNDAGNILGMLVSIAVVVVMSHWQDLHPAWLPWIEFPWRIFFGTLVTFGIAVCFPRTAAQTQVERDAQPRSA
ncbi:MAG: hypothetical protein JO317_06210 [Verrucomicrobiae bacterium]|nr:hypothetical protein [Verrucomicrobiae bacterium]